MAAVGGAGASAEGGEPPPPRTFAPLAARDVPPAFGLQNTGAICHFNALLQGLSSCPAVARVVRGAGAEYLGRTRTGRALKAFFAAHPEPPPATSSAAVLAALLEDLRERRPRAVFGPGQQSASEGLTYLVDMTDAPAAAIPTPADADALARAEIGDGLDAGAYEDAARAIVGAAHARAAKENPLAYLFRTRYRVRTICSACKGISKAGAPETALMTGAWGAHLGEGLTSAGFAARIGAYEHTVDGYRCEGCGAEGPAGRTYQLVRAAEIIVVQRNVYGERRRAGDFPPTFGFTARGGKGKLPYRRVAVIDHSGSLSGGHYTARGLRRYITTVRDDSDGGRRVLALGPYSLNDTAITPLPITPANPDGLALGPGTYLVFYHAE